MKNIFVVSVLLLFLFSCVKEDLSPTPQPTETTTALSTPTGPIVQEGGPYLCPQLADAPCPNLPVFETLFGQLGSTPFTSASSGKVDKVLNCPAIPYELCERPCKDTILTFGYNYNEPWIRVWVGGYFGSPCNDGTFTAAEQQAIVNDIKSQALAYAPYCPGTNIKMYPIAYDSFWDLTCCNYYLGVRVKYAARCRAGGGGGES